MKLIVGQDQIIATFVGQGLGLTFNPPLTTLGWVQELPGEKWRLVGGAVFNDYNGSNIEISIYGPQALNRQSLREALGYVFLQLKCLRLTAKTRRGNAKLRRLLPRLGFKWEGEMKNYFGPKRADNALVFRMDAGAAERWINHGQRS